MRNRLKSITLKGFKTIRCLEDFCPNDLTVLIGPNGAGKSNFVSFFHMMGLALSDKDNLPLYVGQQGGASKLLHDGPITTREIENELTIQNKAGENQYAFRLFYAAEDTLVFADEKYRFSRSDRANRADWRGTGAGHRSPQILERAFSDETARVIRNILQKIKVYQFHNTAYTARMRHSSDAHDDRWLK